MSLVWCLATLFPSATQNIYSLADETSGQYIFQQYLSEKNYFYALGEAKKNYFWANQNKNVQAIDYAYQVSALSIISGQTQQARFYLDQLLAADSFDKTNHPKALSFSLLELDLLLSEKKSQATHNMTHNNFSSNFFHSFFQKAQEVMRHHRHDNRLFDELRYKTLLYSDAMMAQQLRPTIDAQSFTEDYFIGRVERWQQEYDLSQKKLLGWRLASVVPGLAYTKNGQWSRAIMSFFTVGTLSLASAWFWRQQMPATATLTTLLSVKFYLDSIIQSNHELTNFQQKRFQNFIDESITDLVRHRNYFSEKLLFSGALSKKF